MARRRLPAAALLILTLSGSATAQAPGTQPGPTPSGGGLIIKAGDPQPCFGCLVFSGTDQGPRAVQDQNTIQQYAQRFAGTEWSFKGAAPGANGQSQGQVTITKGGQPLFKQSGIYFGLKQPPLIDFYEVYYSDQHVIVHGRFSRNPFPPSSPSGSAQIFYTVIGDDGTPTSAWQYYALTFSQ